MKMETITVRAPKSVAKPASRNVRMTAADEGFSSQDVFNWFKDKGWSEHNADGADFVSAPKKYPGKYIQDSAALIKDCARALGAKAKMKEVPGPGLNTIIGTARLMKDGSSVDLLLQPEGIYISDNEDYHP